MMNPNEITRHKLLPFQTIELASNGDVEAINEILQHYGGYITTLSTRYKVDNNGYLHAYLDENMRRQLETKLITKIMTFQVA